MAPISLVDVYKTLHAIIATNGGGNLAFTDAIADAQNLLDRIGAQLDAESSNSRQFFIETGQYQTIADAHAFRA